MSSVSVFTKVYHPSVIRERGHGVPPAVREDSGITWENWTYTSPWDPTGCTQDCGESWPTSLQGWSLLSLKAHGDEAVPRDWRTANVVSIFRKSQKVNPGHSKSHFDHRKKSQSKSFSSMFLRTWIDKVTGNSQHRFTKCTLSSRIKLLDLWLKEE